jgi:ribosomal protein S20
MATDSDLQALEAEVARLVRELEMAEAYEQRLRQLVVNVREQISTGNTQQALSMLNEALNDIDSQTDVVVPHRQPRS